MSNEQRLVGTWQVVSDAGDDSIQTLVFNSDGSGIVTYISDNTRKFTYGAAGNKLVMLGDGWEYSISSDSRVLILFRTTGGYSYLFRRTR